MKPDDRREGVPQRDLFATREDLDLRRERAEDFRYEGPLGVGDGEEEEEEEYDSGSGKAFFTAAIVGGIVILLVGAALWFRSGTEEMISAEENARLAAATSAAADAPPAAALPETVLVPATPRSIDPLLEEGYRRVPEGRAAAGPRDAPVERPAAAEKPPRPAPSEAAMRPDPAAVGSVRQLVEAGQLDEAARAGEQEARAAGPWSLQVLYACQPETVQRAFRAVPSRTLSLTSARGEGRACWRLLYGSYPDRESAVAAIGRVPEYFRQSGSPRPVETR